MLERFRRGQIITLKLRLYDVAEILTYIGIARDTYADPEVVAKRPEESKAALSTLVGVEQRLQIGVERALGLPRQNWPR